MSTTITYLHTNGSKLRGMAEVDGLLYRFYGVRAGSYLRITSLQRFDMAYRRDDGTVMPERWSRVSLKCATASVLFSVVHNQLAHAA